MELHLIYLSKLIQLLGKASFKLILPVLQLRAHLSRKVLEILLVAFRMVEFQRLVTLIMMMIWKDISKLIGVINKSRQGKMLRILVPVFLNLLQRQRRLAMVWTTDRGRKLAQIKTSKVSKANSSTRRHQWINRSNLGLKNTLRRTIGNKE